MKFLIRLIEGLDILLEAAIKPLLTLLVLEGILLFFNLIQITNFMVEQM